MSHTLYPSPPFTGPTQLPSTPTLITPQPPTPTLTPTLTPKQVMPLLDPATSQLVAGAAGTTSPVILLPAGGNVSLMQTQPFILVNPTDLSSLQQVTTASSIVGRNPSFINAAAAMGSVIPNPSGGYIVIPPGTTFPTPLVNLAGINGSQQQGIVVLSPLLYLLFFFFPLLLPLLCSPHFHFYFSCSLSFSLPLSSP